MLGVMLARPMPGGVCQGPSCSAPAIVALTTVNQPEQYKVELWCRAHFLEWAADVETFEFPIEVKVVKQVPP